jgi:antitoxin component of MazEF toxin-antitoxin module
MESETRKITVHIPADLLEAAQAETGQGVTETVRQGLELLKRARAYRQLREMRGKFTFDMTADKLRGDD